MLIYSFCACLMVSVCDGACGMTPVSAASLACTNKQLAVGLRVSCVCTYRGGVYLICHM